MKVLQDAAEDFSIHLKSSPGTILTPNLRLGIAMCAREARLKCLNCHQAVMDGVCPLTLYSFCADIHHEPIFPIPPGDTIPGEVSKCLVAIIHSILCFQSKINDRWYKDCIHSLQACGILSNYKKRLQVEIDVNELEVASHAVFCEIVVLTAWSHGILSTFLALDRLDRMPELPTWQDMKYCPEPLNTRYSSLLHRIRRDDSVAVAPFFNKRDINTKSPEYKKIDKDVWTKLPFGPMPQICVSFVPMDTVSFGKWMEISYLKPSEMFLNWGEMHTSGRHCASVTRFDIETVAGAVAAAHNCDF